MTLLRMFGLTLATCSAAVLAACTNVGGIEMPANPFATKVPFIVPATSSAAATLRVLSVVPLATPASQMLARAVEGDLLKLKFQEELYYKKLVLEEPVNTLVLSPAQQQAIVTRSATQGIASLRYAGANITRRSYQETRTDCSKKLSFLQLCPRENQINKQVNCEERTAVASADLRVFDRAANKIVLSQVLSGSVVSARCNDSTTSADPDNALTAAADDQLQKRVLATLAPSIELRPLDFMEPDKGIAAAAATGFQQALSFARAKRLDEACARFAELYDGEKESAALTYNTGFCDEARGDLVGAVARYRRASELFGLPNTQIDRHLTASERALKEIGIVTVATQAPRVAAPANDPYVASGRRVALVVGNARYEVGALVNPVNDARLVETTLRKLGFEVTKVENISAARMRTVVDDFAVKAKGADVALFYYAGHAVQVDGENYLIPVDNKEALAPATMREQSLPLGVMLGKLSLDSGPRVKLVFIDACRNSPLFSADRSVTGGLAPIAAPPAGALVAFATAPGRVAKDGSGKNSYFTKHFAALVDTPGLKVEDMLKNVRAAVMRDTKNAQEPSEVSSLTGDFYFHPKR